MESIDAWNCEAATFDEAPDHGLRDPLVREHWRGLLRRLIPTPGRVLDIGCGTGSLSLLLAEAGSNVTGIDFAAAMIDQANAKASQANLEINFHIGDAAQPGFETASFDVILGRHILWAIPGISSDVVLQCWAQLLQPGGRLVMIEGFGTRAPV